jgi:hypothetical protein
MAGKMKKGTPVVEIYFWNMGRKSDTFTVFTRKMVLKSMGAKQGTATVVSSGEMALHRFIPGQIGQTIFAESELSEARIVEIAKAMQDAEIAKLERLNAQQDGTVSAGYLDWSIADAKKPLRVASRETLTAEMKAEFHGTK